MDRWRRIIACVGSLWPGLPRLWRRGSLSGLMESLIFGMLLQVAVVSTVIWPESIGPVSRVVVWFGVLGFWLVFAAPMFWHAVTVLGNGLSVDTTSQREDLLRQAQRKYLQGMWRESERLLERLLGLDGADTDARLLLASLYRHMGRWDAAKAELDRVEVSPGGEKWRFEVLRERLSLVRWKRRGRQELELDTSDRISTDAA